MRYEEPRMEVLELEAEDVVTTSLTDGGVSKPDGTPDGDLGGNTWN